MSVLTTRTATCDACKEERGFKLTSAAVPDGWVSIRLFRRVDENSRQGFHLDLCPRCQEIALDALGVNP